MRPGIAEIGDLAKRITCEVMLFHDNKRGRGDCWKDIPADEHLRHALVHCQLARQGDSSEPHAKHALTRCVMACAVLGMNNLPRIPLDLPDEIA